MHICTYAYTYSSLMQESVFGSKAFQQERDLTWGLIGETLEDEGMLDPNRSAKAPDVWTPRSFLLSLSVRFSLSMPSSARAPDVWTSRSFPIKFKCKFKFKYALIRQGSRCLDP